MLCGGKCLLYNTKWKKNTEWYLCSDYSYVHFFNIWTKTGKKNCRNVGEYPFFLLILMSLQQNVLKASS